MSVVDLPDYTGYSSIKNVYGDVKIYTPSGLSVSPGATVHNCDSADTTLSAGETKVIYQDLIEGEGKRKILQIGLNIWSQTSGTTFNVNAFVIRIRVDGVEKWNEEMGWILGWLDSGHCYAFISGRPAGTYVIDPPSKGAFTMTWCKINATAPEYRGGIMDFDVEGAGFIFRFEAEYSSSFELEIANLTGVDLYVGVGAVYGDYI